MKIAILTNEYPPHVYGGAGVHVDYISRELAKLEEGKHQITILCFGEQRQNHSNLRVAGVEPHYRIECRDPHYEKLLDSLLRNLMMGGTLEGADVVHCHTWYTHFAGCLVQNLLGIPLVLTTHSLEPHRPWKEEQLGAAYKVSTWLEKTAYQNADGVIAVSQSMKTDVNELYGVPREKIRVIHNGIDLNEYRPRPDPAVLAAYRIDPDKPFVLFVGRITRQKGIIHLVNAIRYLHHGVQVVLCAGSPDTEEIGQEMTASVKQAQAERRNEVIWIPHFLSKSDVISLYTHAAIFVCPSIYEPFGIINLEAMACETPVVAAAIGGIPEVVVHDETGLLVPFEHNGAFDLEPKYPERFSKDLADAVNGLLASPQRLRNMGMKSRQRVEEHFSWTSIARKTLDFYKELAKPG